MYKILYYIHTSRSRRVPVFGTHFDDSRKNVLTSKKKKKPPEIVYLLGIRMFKLFVIKNSCCHKIH